MHKKIYSLFIALLIIAMATSPVAAKGNIQLSGSFALGSLHFNGTMTGLGGYTDGVTVELIGSGIPVVLCTNQGGNQASGQNPPKVSTSGVQFITPDLITKKGKADVGVVTGNLINQVLPGTAGGCPNDNWTAKIVNILWTDAILNVYNGEGNTGALLLTQVYKCDPTLQTATTLSCTLVFETSYH